MKNDTPFMVVVLLILIFLTVDNFFIRNEAVRDFINIAAFAVVLLLFMFRLSRRK
ncbi:hypothetical protein [Paenibacillus sambharensis]|uniref:hypothetical protein n=1 Tax=Paenibacillus sambharensis TaxID=1803190 RepID=UPI0015E8BA5D|nr:hypothetical protein [Paenibacillus sambharensis]